MAEFFYALLRRVGAWRFNRTAKRVLQTPPLAMQEGGPLFISLVCHRDVYAYMLAVKSVYRSFGKGRVIALDDGSLTEGDRLALQQHIPLLDIVEAQNVTLPPETPQYIVWRRLFHILDRVKHDYVIQIDADIVVQGLLDDAVKAYEENKPFIVVNRRHPGRVSFREMSDWINEVDWSANGLQVRTELALAGLPDPDDRFYVRGTAAFAGWPKECATRAKVEDFSADILVAVGESWLSWGSEQISTNYLLGDSRETVLLSYPDYVNNSPALSVKRARLVHFYGTHRFYRGRYRRMARAVIRDLLLSAR